MSHIKNKQPSRFTAGVLSLLAGGFGAGRVYLKYYNIAVLQILANLLTFGTVGTVWGMAEGILIMSGKIKYDADKNKII
ncbi:MAG: NINE protein [Clostridia bacterium]|nr:NINE protein [Clostridia bacterium]